MTMTAQLELGSPHPLTNSRDRADRPADRAGLGINAALAMALALALLVALVGFGGGAAANDPLEPASVDSEVSDAIEIYVVQPGDTLWAIAGRIRPDGVDLRPTVDALSRAAGGASLEIGQRIVIDHAMLGG
jgi:nucleoid-associated protein YgaU